MKHLLLTTIAAVVLVGCGPSEADRALLKATQEGNIKAVKQHLAAGTDVNAKNRDGVTPLHTAAANDYKEIVELLIVEGANVNATNVDGWTPLFGAAVLGKNKIVELLIAKGADVNAKDKDGETPLDIATHPKTAALLRKHGGKHSIFGAAAQGNIEAVKEHLADGADLDAQDTDGDTPLHDAAMRDHKEITELLIDAGADVNAKDVNGKTPLDAAIGAPRRRPKTIDLLRKHGGKTGEELKAEGK